MWKQIVWASLENRLKEVTDEEGGVGQSGLKSQMRCTHMGRRCLSVLWTGSLMPLDEGMSSSKSHLWPSKVLFQGWWERALSSKSLLFPVTIPPLMVRICSNLSFAPDTRRQHCHTSAHVTCLTAFETSAAQGKPLPALEGPANPWITPFHHLVMEMEKAYWLLLLWRTGNGSHALRK